MLTPAQELMLKAAKALRQSSDDLRELAGLLEDSVNGRADSYALERSCKGKKAYPTAERAGQAAASRPGVELRIYECEFCKEFHLTSKTMEEFAGVRR